MKALCLFRVKPNHIGLTQNRPSVVVASSPCSNALHPHVQYLALGGDSETRQAAYRDLFRSALEEKAIDDIRLALQQRQVVGSEKLKMR